ncbi:MAG TPA: FAD-dependent oxidoreductase [Gemmatimonadales bacterium]|nr:FAD-dependent oxidoreductase [Gemmatimonadales bacterium]
MSETIGADVAVIGAGPAGITAAAVAAESGRRVVVLDEGRHPGGQVWRHTDRAALPGTAAHLIDRLERSGARVLEGATVFDIAPGFRVFAERHGEAVQIRTGRVILATGARERFLPFPGWTLPNVVGVGGAQALLKSGASFAGKRVVVAGSGPLLLAVAAALARAGAKIAVVAERAPWLRVARFALGLWRRPRDLAAALRFRWAFLGARYRWGTWVASAEGDARVQRVTLTDGRRSWTENCDVLCTAAGLVPATELARLAGCDVHDGAVRVDDRMRTSAPEIWCAGEPVGVGGVDVAAIEGEIAGRDAAGAPVPASLARARRGGRAYAGRIAAAFSPEASWRAAPPADTIVCRCEDVRMAALRPGWTPRQAKLYTRAGMGPCQGRVCGPALEVLFDWLRDAVRAPIAPVSVHTLLDSWESIDARP